MTEVDIANMALTKCGEEAVLVQIDDKTKAGRLCTQNYPIARRSTLAKHPWKFAITRVILDVNIDAKPAFGWQSAYLLPDNYIRTVSVNGHDEPWTREGNYLLTQLSGPINLRYVYDILEVDKYDPLFCDMLAADLANRICYAITQSDSRVNTVMQEAERIAKKARHTDAIEQSPQHLIADDFDEVRIGPNRGFVRDPMT